MDVRIGVIHTVMEIDVELPADADRDKIKKKIEAALADDDSIMWLTDRTGADLAIRTRTVIDATGVWSAEPDHPFGGSSMRILPSRGAHLVVPRARIPSSAGMAVRVPGKIVFLVPWPDHWLIGTTDAPYDGAPDRPNADAWEIDRLLAAAKRECGAARQGWWERFRRLFGIRPASERRRKRDEKRYL